MNGTPSWFHWEGADLILQIQVQPRASRDEVTGPHGGHLRIRLTAPPVEGKANEHLLAFVAKLCGVAKREVTLEAGIGGRRKRLRIHAPRSLPAGVVRAPRSGPAA